MRVLIALGGNAMTGEDGSATPQAQQAAIARAMEHVADLVADGHEVTLTHGNGPQVGNLLVKNELAASVVPPVPLDWCGAQTQATIGFTVMNALEFSLARRGLDRPVATVVTRTRVAEDDPAFSRASKPIGRYLPADEAAVMIAHGQVWEDRGERGWRRVVASPDPVEILDAATVATLISAGFIVVCSGGGGIPVVSRDGAALRGVEAVIDKDLSAALLSHMIGADLMLIATDVPNVVLDWGTTQARPIGEISAPELRRLAAGGQFASGSMGPKVEAALRFVEGGGRRSVITALDRIAAAVAGRTGTAVIQGLSDTPQPEG